MFPRSGHTIFFRVLAFFAFAAIFSGCNGGSKSGAPPPSPVILQVQPSVGPLEGGTEVVISGENFTPNSQVFFGQAEALQVFFSDPQHLQAVTPPQSEPGSVPVTVRTENGEATLQEGFTYEQAVKPLPEITAIEPKVGPLAGGNTVLVTGENFQETSRVFFGAKKSEKVTFLEVHSLQAVVPPGEQVGPVDVKVQTEVGSFTLREGYTYALPLIHSIAPSEGPLSGGTEILIEGEFLLSEESTSLLLGSQEAKILENQETLIRALTPPGSEPGPVEVRVVNGFGTTSIPEGFVYLQPLKPPTISSLSPEEGSASGGTTVILKGSGFEAPELNVQLCGTEVTEFIVIDDSTLQLLTPPVSYTHLTLPTKA